MIRVGIKNISQNMRVRHASPNSPCLIKKAIVMQKLIMDATHARCHLGNNFTVNCVRLRGVLRRALC